MFVSGRDRVPAGRERAPRPGRPRSRPGGLTWPERISEQGSGGRTSGSGPSGAGCATRWMSSGPRRTWRPTTTTRGAPGVASALADLRDAWDVHQEFTEDRDRGLFVELLEDNVEVAAPEVDHLRRDHLVVAASLTRAGELLGAPGAGPRDAKLRDVAHRAGQADRRPPPARCRPALPGVQRRPDRRRRLGPVRPAVRRSAPPTRRPGERALTAFRGPNWGVCASSGASPSSTCAGSPA